MFKAILSHPCVLQNIHHHPCAIEIACVLPESLQACALRFVIII